MGGLRLVAAVGVLGSVLFAVRTIGFEVREEVAENILERTAPGESARDAAFTTAIPRGEVFQKLQVRGRTVAHALPKDLRGLVFFFHGTGGSHKVIERTEFRAVFKELASRGLGVVVPDSDLRTGDLVRFDDRTAIADNPDIQRMIAIHRGLKEAGVISLDTPLFAMGYSAGGPFASAFGHAARQAGLPIKAVVYHNSAGRSDVLGSAPPLPSLFLAADHDEKVDPKTVALAAKQHELGGNETVLLRHVPRKLTKGWFTREAGVTRAQSEQVFEAAVASGLVAPDGRIKAAPADYRGAVDKLLAQIDRGLRKPVKSQLLVLYATHAFNGEYAARECEFLLGHL